MVFDAPNAGDVLGRDDKRPLFLFGQIRGPKVHHAILDGDVGGGDLGPSLHFQLGQQLVAKGTVVGLLANVIWVGTVTFLTMRALQVLVGNRVPVADELAGLDVPEMGMEGYSTEPLPP